MTSVNDLYAVAKRQIAPGRNLNHVAPTVPPFGSVRTFSAELFISVMTSYHLTSLEFPRSTASVFSVLPEIKSGAKGLVLQLQTVLCETQLFFSGCGLYYGYTRHLYQTEAQRGALLRQTYSHGESPGSKSSQGVNQK